MKKKAKKSEAAAKPKPQVSRQRLWQIRRRKLGLCRSCSAKAGGASYCRSCRERNKEAWRAKYGPAKFHCSHCNEKGHNRRTCAKAKKAAREARRVERNAKQGIKRDHKGESRKRRERARLLSPGWPPPFAKKKSKKDYKGWP